MRTEIEKYIIRRTCKIIYISYFYSHIQAIFIKSQRIFNTGLKLTVYRPQLEWKTAADWKPRGSS